MIEPSFRYLCSYRAAFTEPQQQIGKAHFGRRMIAALTGGEVEGERLRGRVMPSGGDWATRSEEHTSELQSLMRSSYAVFCLKKKTHATQLPRNKHNNKEQDST